MQHLVSRSNIQRSTGVDPVTAATVYLDIAGTLNAWEIQMLVLTVIHRHNEHPANPAIPPPAPDDMTITAQVMYLGLPVGPIIEMGPLIEYTDDGVTVTVTNHSPLVYTRELTNGLRLNPRAQVTVEFAIANGESSTVEVDEFSVAAYGQLIPIYGRR